MWMATSPSPTDMRPLDRPGHGTDRKSQASYPEHGLRRKEKLDLQCEPRAANGDSCLSPEGDGSPSWVCHSTRENRTIN